MNKDILAVDFKHMTVYDFLKDGETEAELLERANEARRKEIATWGGHSEKYSCETFEGYLKMAKEKEYKIIGMNTKKLKEIFI